MFKNERLEPKIQTMTLTSEVHDAPWTHIDAKATLLESKLLDNTNRGWNVQNQLATLYRISQFIPEFAEQLRTNADYQNGRYLIAEFMLESVESGAVENYIPALRHLMEFDPELLSKVDEQAAGRLEHFYDQAVGFMHLRSTIKSAMTRIGTLAESLIGLSVHGEEITPKKIRDAIGWNISGRSAAREVVRERIRSSKTITKATSLALSMHALESDWCEEEILPLFREKEVWTSMRNQLEFFRQRNMLMEYVELLYDMHRLSKLLDTTAGLPTLQSAKPISRAI